MKSSTVSVLVAFTFDTKTQFKGKALGTRLVSQGKDKERLYLDSHFKSVFLFLFSLAFSLAF